MDVGTGEIKAIILPGPGSGLFGWRPSSEIVIHWNRSLRIGQDVILVDLPPTTRDAVYRHTLHSIKNSMKNTILSPPAPEHHGGHTD